MLQHVSTHDSLTGLYNRAYLEYEFQRRRDSMPLPCVLIACDIDGLQMTNETLGHAAGDQRLIMAGVLLSELVEKRRYLVTGRRRRVCPGSPRREQAQAERLVSRTARQCRAVQSGKSRLCFSACRSAMRLRMTTPVELSRLMRDADNMVRREKLLRSQSTRSGLVNTMMTLLEARDFITEGHAERLEMLVGSLAERLGLSVQST
jgi:diguanylate cyclase (GGDEF)-like protein